jgi:hypothetical protein
MQTNHSDVMSMLIRAKLIAEKKQQNASRSRASVSKNASPPNAAAAVTYA